MSEDTANGAIKAPKGGRAFEIAGDATFILTLGATFVGLYRFLGVWALLLISVSLIGYWFSRGHYRSIWAFEAPVKVSLRRPSSWFPFFTLLWPTCWPVFLAIVCALLVPVFTLTCWMRITIGRADYTLESDRIAAKIRTAKEAFPDTVPLDQEGDKLENEKHGMQVWIRWMLAGANRIQLPQNNTGRTGTYYVLAYIESEVPFKDNYETMEGFVSLRDDKVIIDDAVAFLVFDSNAGARNVWYKPTFRQVPVHILDKRREARVVLEKPSKGERVAIFLRLKNSRRINEIPAVPECFQTRYIGVR